MSDNNNNNNEDQSMKGLFGSDSEDEQLGQLDGGTNKSEAGATMQDLFGSDDEDLQPGPSGAANAEPEYRRQSTPFEENEEEPIAPRGPPISVPAHLHDVLASAPLRLAKLSNILAIEPRPFDATTFEQEASEYVDDKGHTRVHLRDANTVRWRHAAAPDGSLVRESNARLIRWSDGSVTLSVGQETMDAREIDVAGDHAYLFARHPNLIQGQGPLTKKLVFRPASLTSGSHKRLAAAVDRQHGARGQRVRATTTLVDPKRAKEEREKAEEARIKDLEKLAGKQQRQMRKYAGSGGGAAARSRALSAAYLEEEEEEEEEEDDGFIVRDEEDGGAGAGYAMIDEDDNVDDDMGMRRAVARPRYDDAEEEEAAARKLSAAKRAPPPPSAGGGVLVDSDEDISEEDKPTAKKKQRTLVMESDSD